MQRSFDRSDQAASGGLTDMQAAKAAQKIV